MHPAIHIHTHMHTHAHDTHTQFKSVQTACVIVCVQMTCTVWLHKAWTWLWWFGLIEHLQCQAFDVAKTICDEQEASNLKRQLEGMAVGLLKQRLLESLLAICLETNAKHDRGIHCEDMTRLCLWMSFPINHCLWATRVRCRKCLPALPLFYWDQAETGQTDWRYSTKKERTGDARAFTRWLHSDCPGSHQVAVTRWLVIFQKSPGGNSTYDKLLELGKLAFWEWSGLLPNMLCIIKI